LKIDIIVFKEKLKIKISSTDGGIFLSLQLKYLWHFSLSQKSHWNAHKNQSIIWQSIMRCYAIFQISGKKHLIAASGTIWHEVFQCN